MTKHLEIDLKAVERSLLETSTVVEEMVDLAIKALRFRQFELIDQVLEREEEINSAEVKIEEQALNFIALHQPVAVDLRRAAAVLKINNDLERIADIAVNITERAECLAPRPDFEIPSMLIEMTTLAHLMLRESLDAFGRSDVELARNVCTRDDEVDELHRQLVNELYRAMRSDSHLIDPALNYFSAARHIERVADHATNIAEDVIYLVKGEIARHRIDRHPSHKIKP
ncbi:phosphate signaling complex protein PhoU [Lignipirellula cremea]|uniref:Phosphate-specific transport system accessory protein PhoU n=1 Tax=Lignipirellula cremea TaxID=2528010 RepID=A0A518E2C0_9BACT|nr:phosphate signaling complex protein PhoU [Lignipirellula cremea]QDU98214.1 hypothetical protein Pla8534_60750 [Lignipirellula cremea]